MRIERIEIIAFEIPYREGLDVTTSLGRHSSLRNILVGLHADTGEVGWGEATPLPTHSGETQESILALLQHTFGPMLLRRDPRDIPLLLGEMDRLLWGQTFSKSAVEYALHEVVAKHCGIPLYQLLGGKCRETFPLGWTIGWKSLEATLDEAAEVRVERQLAALRAAGDDPDNVSAGDHGRRRRHAEGARGGAHVEFAGRHAGPDA